MQFRPLSCGCRSSGTDSQKDTTSPPGSQCILRESSAAFRSILQKWSGSLWWLPSMAGWAHPKRPASKSRSGSAQPETGKAKGRAPLAPGLTNSPRAQGGFSRSLSCAPTFSSSWSLALVNNREFVDLITSMTNHISERDFSSQHGLRPHPLRWC